MVQVHIASPSVSPSAWSVGLEWMARLQWVLNFWFAYFHRKSFLQRRTCAGRKAPFGICGKILDEELREGKPVYGSVKCKCKRRFCASCGSAVIAKLDIGIKPICTVCGEVIEEVRKYPPNEPDPYWVMIYVWDTEINNLLYWDLVHERQMTAEANKGHHRH